MSDAGTISRDWYNDCLANGSASDIKDWFERALNTDVEIDESLAVYARNHWLTQHEIDNAIETIEAGV